jgi:hypothetical protein
MTSPISVPIGQVPQEFDRILADVKRLISIYSRKLVFEPIDPVAFVNSYFFLCQGQRCVVYEDELDLTTIQGRLLFNYPRQPVIRNLVVNAIPEKKITVQVHQPFASVQVEFQAINIASKGSEYDGAYKVEGQRSQISERVHADVCVYEKYDNGVFDVMKGPDNLEKKPYSCRRQFLTERGFEMVPKTTGVLGSLLVKDSEPYNAGGTGGYFSVSLSDNICVNRVVDSNNCVYSVRGSMTSDNHITVIKVQPVVEEDSTQKVVLNLSSGEIVSQSLFVHDVVDYYTVTYSLPLAYTDVKLKDSREHKVYVCNLSVRLEGNVQEVGC